MCKKNLEMDYYFDKNGNRIAGNMNCFTNQLYFLLKNKYSFKHPTILFLESFVPQMKIVNGKLIDINYDFSYSVKIEDYYFKLNTRLSDYEHIFGDIQRCLNNNQYVLIRTFTERLPFFYSFIGDNADPATCTPLHYLLVVYVDDEFLYYVEAPELVHIKNHVEYNKNVGKVRKEKLWNSFSVYIDYTTIDVDTERIKEPFKLNEYFDYIIRAYGETCGGLTEGSSYSSFGSYAIFKELCESNSISLKDETVDSKLNLFQLIIAKLHNTFSKKDLLITALSEYKHLFNADSLNQFSGLVSENRELWVNLYTSIIKLYNSDRYSLGSKIGQKMDDIIISEKELVEGIKRFSGINSQVIINIE